MRKRPHGALDGVATFVLGLVLGFAEPSRADGGFNPGSCSDTFAITRLAVTSVFIDGEAQPDDPLLDNTAVYEVRASTKEGRLVATLPTTDASGSVQFVMAGI